MTEDDKLLVERLDNFFLTDQTPFRCDAERAARLIEAQAAEIERLRGALLWIRGVCAEELDLEYTDAMRRAFQRNVRDAALKALTDPEAGQPWLRTYDAHLKGECERCCGNGQTYGPNSGEDIICPDCEGTGRVD